MTILNVDHGGIGLFQDKTMPVWLQILKMINLMQEGLPTSSGEGGEDEVILDMDQWKEIRVHELRSDGN